MMNFHKMTNTLTLSFELLLKLFASTNLPPANELLKRSMIASKLLNTNIQISKKSQKMNSLREEGFNTTTEVCEISNFKVKMARLQTVFHVRHLQTKKHCKTGTLTAFNIDMRSPNNIIANTNSILVVPYNLLFRKKYYI